MNKVKAGLRGLNPLEKAGLAAIVYGNMNGNPDFPNPSPSMAEFHAAYLELKAANLAALDRGRMAIARRNRAKKVMEQYLSRLAGYVNSVCLGDTLKLMRSGFELTKRSSPINSLDVPMSLKARPTEFPGQLKLRWKRVQGAIMYTVERSNLVNGQPGPWERVDETSRTYYDIDGLRSDEMHCFRVRALGTQVKGPYSQIAFGKAS